MIGLVIMKNNAITLFGGTGDLTYRKLLPALYNLEALNKLADHFKIIAIGRRDYTSEDYIAITQKWVEEYTRTEFDKTCFERFTKRITYFKMDISKEEEYANLQAFYVENNIKQHVYYYAVSPSFFMPITHGLQKYCHQDDVKVIIEKPFGEDLEKATLLNKMLEKTFGKENIYHIDHYLGKEMIQNILAIRFNNAVFKAVWNNEYIDNVQISASESVGVGTRAGYYDQNGALKDMVQNHLLQLLSIVALEQPSKDSSINEEQLKLLKSLKLIENVEEQVILGQYNGYLEEENIAPSSQTETFAALKVFIDNERWQNVPFYIRTGKKLGERETQVVIKFKSENNVDGNVLIIKIQPDEGIIFRFNIKKPGTENEVEQVSMNFCQNCVLENRINTPEAYERLLEACFKSDHSLFSKWDQIVISWHFMNDLIVKYEASSKKLYPYVEGSMGPRVANELVNWEK